MMDIFFIKIDKYGYDEYIGFVIIAHSAEEARNIVINIRWFKQKENFNDPKMYEKVGGYTGKKEKAFILLTAFNAG